MDFNFNDIKIDTFNITFDNGETVTLRPPKLKVMRKAAGIKKGNNEEAVSKMIEIIAVILSNNKESRSFTADFVESEFDTSDLISFLTHYFEWVASIKQNPNF